MSHPSEQPYPLLNCCSSIHDTQPRSASWLVDLDDERAVPYCSSCHFLLKRSGAISADRRIPVATMVRTFPSNLTSKELLAEIEKSKKEADEMGYWSPDREFYDILNVDGSIRITFRRA